MGIPMGIWTNKECKSKKISPNPFYLSKFFPKTFVLLRAYKNEYKIMPSSNPSAIPMDKQTFIDSLYKSMQESARQMRLTTGRPISHATREEALRQVEMLKAAKEAYKQTGK
jgi:hypothetical protein